MNSVPVTEGSDSRIKVVDLVRTVSIVAVLANHFFDVKFTPATTVLSPLEDCLWHPLYRFAVSGAYGVSIFFVLSGFLITRMTAQRNPDLYLVNRRQFYIRRVARIVPLLLLILLLVLMVVSLCTVAKFEPSSQPYMEFVFHPRLSNFDWLFFVSFFTLSLNWLLIFSGRAYGLQVGILWSIAVEEQFYFFLPLTLRVIGSAKRFVPLLLGLVMVGPIARWLGNFYAPDKYMASFDNSFGSFDLISMGVLLFLLERTIGARLAARKGLCLAICLAGLLLGSITYFTTFTGEAVHRIYAPSLVGLGVFMFLLGGLHVPAFNKLPRLLTLPGELSYGMYLYHPLVLFLLSPFLIGKGPIFSFAIYVASTTFLGWLSFTCFEQRVNRLIRKKLL